MVNSFQVYSQLLPVGYYPNELQNPGFEEVTPTNEAQYWISMYSENDYTLEMNETVFDSLSVVVKMQSVDGNVPLGIAQNVSKIIFGIIFAGVF